VCSGMLNLAQVNHHCLPAKTWFLEPSRDKVANRLVFKEHRESVFGSDKVAPFLAKPRKNKEGKRDSLIVGIFGVVCYPLRGDWNLAHSLNVLLGVEMILRCCYAISDAKFVLVYMFLDLIIRLRPIRCSHVWVIVTETQQSRDIPSSAIQRQRKVIMR
jgi:hypothetical protein